MAGLRSSRPHFDFERQAMAAGLSPVCGIDEAGRGPWAGPVVAAAVILDPGRIPPGLDDSKKLSPQRRATLFDLIMEQAQTGVGVAGVDRIDGTNVLAATLWAMAEAVRVLSNAPGLALVDGNRAPSLACPVRTIVSGDALSLSVAAASIVAKVTRDRLMAELDLLYPAYGFASHKGYGTAAHARALTALGPCPEHRRSFKPVKALFAR